jgi:carbonic anhydrase
VQCSKSDEETCALKGEIAKLRDQIAPLTKAAQDSTAPHLSHAQPAQEPQAALARLVKGNQAFVAGKADKSITGDVRRKELLAGQHPVAAILGCADSRTPPIHLFDLGLGDGFECRNAGNIVDEPTVASLEYAVAHLGVRLIVIMSHTQCGAVKAAAANASDTPAIVSLVGRIRPAVDDAKKSGATTNLPERAALRNAQRQRDELCSRSQLLRTLNDKRELRIVVASYELASGAVQWMSLDGLKDPTQVAANTEAEPAKEEAKVTSKPAAKSEEKAHH